MKKKWLPLLTVALCGCQPSVTQDIFSMEPCGIISLDPSTRLPNLWYTDFDKKGGATVTSDWFIENEESRYAVWTIRISFHLLGKKVNPLLSQADNHHLFWVYDCGLLDEDFPIKDQSSIQYRLDFYDLNASLSSIEPLEKVYPIRYTAQNDPTWDTSYLKYSSNEKSLTGEMPLNPYYNGPMPKKNGISFQKLFYEKNGKGLFVQKTKIALDLDIQSIRERLEGRFDQFFPVITLQFEFGNGHPQENTGTAYPKPLFEDINAHKREMICQSFAWIGDGYLSALEALE